MKSIYTIVYSPINAVGHERLNLGMIMLNDLGEVSFRYSQEKLNFARKLFSDDAYKLIKSYLSSIEQKIANKGDLINNLEDFKSEYLTYLANYSHNLVAFTQPKAVNLELTDDNFTKLFEKFIYKMPVESLYQVPNESKLVQTKHSFIPRVEKRVNVDVELNADKLDFVLFNMQVDMMGRNDKPVLNQFIDFDNTTPYSLEKKINSYIGLIKPFELKDGLGKYFIVGDEPSKENNKQRIIWKHLSDSTLIKQHILEIVTTEEVEKIEEYLNKHEVRPYFEE